MDWELFESVSFDPVRAEGKEIKYDESCVALLNNIREQIEKIDARGYEPEYILVNQRNYERLVAYACHVNYDTKLIDEIIGCKVIIWDLPVDYANVVCKASDTFAYNIKY